MDSEVLEVVLIKQPVQLIVNLILQILSVPSMPVNTVGSKVRAGAAIRLHVPVFVKKINQILNVPSTLQNMADSKVPEDARMRLPANHIVKQIPPNQDVQITLNRAGFPGLVGVTQEIHVQATAEQITRIQHVPRMLESIKISTSSNNLSSKF